MAASSFILYIFFAQLFLLSSHSNTNHVHGCFTRIFSFGDSLSYTGNHLYCTANHPDFIGFFPFGETYFHKPTGRACNGRLIVDFIAQSFELPLIPPSLAGNTTKYFQSGANFAMFGATILNNKFFEKWGLVTNITMEDFSLDIQVKLFKSLLPLISQGFDVGTVMNNSLFIVGEIGGNDYNRPLIGSISRGTVCTWVPYVIARIGNALEKLITLGAKTIVVPGLLPLGCAPAYLSIFQSNNSLDYDSKTGCLNWANELSQYHNRVLQIQLQKQRTNHPDVTIIYADYYGAQMSIIQNANQLGFPTPLYACCGGPDAPYNFSFTVQCGSKNATLCPDPTKYISWDGVHPTETVNNIIANGVLNGPYSNPTPISKLC